MNMKISLRACDNFSFERNKKSNVYYIFVLERETIQRDFLLLPFIKIDELIRNGTINKVDGSKQVSFRILHKDSETAYVNKITDACDVSRFLNAWDVLL